MKKSGFISCIALLIVHASHSQTLRFDAWEQQDFGSPTFRNNVTSANMGVGENFQRARLRSNTTVPFTTVVGRVRYSVVAGGDSFGRMALYSRGANVSGTGRYKLPTDASNSLSSDFTTNGITTHLPAQIGSSFRAETRGSFSGISGNGNAEVFTELQNAPLLTRDSGLSPVWDDLTVFDIDPFTPGIQIDPMMTPSITINWNSGNASGSRALINYVDHGSFASPHRDDLTIFSALIVNSITVQTGANSAVWSAGDATISKSVSAVSNAYVLDLTSYSIGDTVSLTFSNLLHHQAYFGASFGPLGSNTLYMQSLGQRIEIVPEPTSLIALGSGLLGLLAARRRKHKAD